MTIRIANVGNAGWNKRARVRKARRSESLGAGNWSVKKYATEHGATRKKQVGTRGEKRKKKEIRKIKVTYEEGYTRCEVRVQPTAKEAWRLFFTCPPRRATLIIVERCKHRRLACAPVHAYMKICLPMYCFNLLVCHFGYKWNHSLSSTARCCKNNTNQRLRKPLCCCSFQQRRKIKHTFLLRIILRISKH